MNKSEKIGRWSRLYKIYGSHLEIIEISLVLALIVTLSFGFVYPRVTLPLGFIYLNMAQLTVALVILFSVVHGIIVQKIAKNELYPYKILYLQRSESLALLFSYTILVSILVAIVMLAYIMPTLEVKWTIWNFIYWVIVLDTMLVATLFCVFYSKPLSSHVKSRLCLLVAMSGLCQLSNMNEMERRKYVRKHFRWFRDGLHSYNKHIIRNFPDHPVVKDIDLYYDHAYLITLVGNDKEVNELSTHMRESYDAIGKKKTEGNFRLFLIALQRIRGKEVDKDVSINELSDLIITVPWSKRVATWVKTYGAFFAGIITLVASIAQIMTFFK